MRGYQKLADAISAFDFDFKDQTVLDIGSSTGGFTECALDHGAKRVIAVEKGTNQMAAPLRFDPRVDLHEKTDIMTVGVQISPSGGLRSAAARAEAPAARGRLPEEPSEQRTCSLFRGDDWQATLVDGPAGRGPQKDFICTPDVIVADVSFISLTKILKYAKLNLARPTTQFLVMLKPQFEATPAQLSRGVVKNAKIRRDIIKHFEQWLKQNNFLIIKKRDNDLPGKTGNLERFYWLTLAK